ncbi:hypothetical protein [Pantoea sp.]|uniref:hypothetical protein n=1 Tax=Pantoea sp. TaxID=69393 RepID=UPI0031D05275
MPLALEAFTRSASGDGATKPPLHAHDFFRNSRAAVRLLSNNQTALLSKKASFLFFVFFSQSLSLRPAYSLPDNTAPNKKK